VIFPLVLFKTSCCVSMTRTVLVLKMFFFLKMRTLLSYRCTREVRGCGKNDELKGKNKENRGVFVFGSSFSGLRFRVLVFGS